MKIELKILNKEFYRDYENETGNKAEYSIPKYATSGSAAVDLICTEDVTIYPGETKLIPTGLAIWIGSARYKAFSPLEVWGHVTGLILPRSGLGSKGLVLANTVGVIDEDYQGELLVSAWNRTRGNWSDLINDRDPLVEAENIELKAGDRFAQLMFVPVIKAQFEVVEDFSNCTQRGNGGFGSSGE